jgi:hypothetical protein
MTAIANILAKSTNTKVMEEKEEEVNLNVH